MMHFRNTYYYYQVNIKHFNTNDIFVRNNFEYGTFKRIFFHLNTRIYSKVLYYSTAIIVNRTSTSLADEIASVTTENMHVPMY